MYITTWGPTNYSVIQTVYQSKASVMHIRKFIEAVLAYTGANYIRVISHSMGVTIARKAIKGGSAIDHIAGSYEVGQSLSNRVRTLIGLAGVNLGLM
jgi:triacylglycerol lipase